MSDAARSQLAPTGVLRAAINLGNALLVTGKTESGDPIGVSPDFAKAIADRLGVPVSYVSYDTPAELGDYVGKNIWDIGLIGAEPARAKTIDFTAAYTEIEATYLVPPGSTVQKAAEVDSPGKTIAVASLTAYDLWLTDNIKHARLIKAKGAAATWDLFLKEKADAFAGLRVQIRPLLPKLPGSRMLEDYFTTVQQAVGTAKGNDAGLAFLSAFVAEAKTSGLIAKLIEKHKVGHGLTVAPPV